MKTMPGLADVARGFRFAVITASALAGAAAASDLLIQSFNSAGRLSFDALNDGTNYNYRVEWASTPSGPWSAFAGAGVWLDAIQAQPGSCVTGSVPMCYRVVATRGDYLSVDLSGGTNAAFYPAESYRTLADVPGGPAAESYKTTRLLLRLVPKGVFMLGSPESELGRSADEPAHRVTLSHDFYMGVFEVTQRQWELVMGDRPSFFTNGLYYASRPVEQVSYEDIRGSGAGSLWPAGRGVDADSFMGRLRAKAGWPEADLPTEAQWEAACRAGAVTALNSGKNLAAADEDPNTAEVARYFFNSGSAYEPDCDAATATARVGSYLPNAWGLYDMHGNILEWCLDWYGDCSEEVADPEGSATGTGRVRRGGSWGSSADGCRSAFRYALFGPDYRNSSIGFRVAVTPGR